MIRHSGFSTKRHARDFRVQMNKSAFWVLIVANAILKPVNSWLYIEISLLLGHKSHKMFNDVIESGV